MAELDLQATGNIFAGELTMGSNPATVVSLSGARSLAEHWTKTLQVRVIDGNAKVIEPSGANRQTW